jgi:hypothetical protein
LTSRAKAHLEKGVHDLEKNKNRGETPMYMFKYITKRLGLMLITFFIIFTMCFVLIKLLPIPANVLPGME